MKIERMIIICCAMFLAIFAIIGYDGIVLYKQSKTTLSDAPILSGASTTSLTGQTFSIQGVYRSEDNTQAMIVISGDLSKTSYIADTYVTYLLGPSAAEYSGGIYVFGDLNLLCVYVTDVNGFKAEQTQLLVKSTASTAASTKNETDDMSFYINLGASGAQTVSFMSESGLDVERMANSAFAHDDDAAIREELPTLQSTMVSCRTTLSNVRQNIDKAGLQLPAFPEWMLDDTIANRENTNSEYIQTSYVFAGAADFDWENITRLNNYAEAAGVTVDSINSSAERPSIEDYIPTEWYYADNSVVTNPTSSESALINQYSEALKAYYSAKIEYQDKVASLITTQQTYIDAITKYTSNVGNNALIGVKQKN